MGKVDPKTLGNPIVLTAAETWVTNGFSIQIDHATLEQVSADTTSSVIFAKDSSSAEASNICVRDARSGINTVIWDRPVTFSRLYLRTLSAGVVTLHLK